MQTPVAVEKGTKAVISVNFSVYGRRTFNNLTYERISLLKFPKKTFSTPTPDYVNNRTVMSVNVLTSVPGNLDSLGVFRDRW